MARKRKFAWTLPESAQYNGPAHDTYVVEMGHDETMKFIDWLTDTTNVDRDLKIKGSDEIMEMLEDDTVACVGTRFATFSHIKEHTRARANARLERMLRTLEHGRKPPVDPGYRYDSTYDTVKKWSLMMPRDSNFWAESRSEADLNRQYPVGLVSLQVVALRVLFAMLFDACFLSRRRTREFKITERNFAVKWKWLQNVSWMGNVYAQDIVEGKTREDHRVELRRPLVEAAGLLYVHAGLVYIFDYVLFGPSCMFIFRYKEKEHSILAYMAMYASLIWSSSDDKDSYAARFSLDEALRVMKWYIGDKPLPNIFSLAFAAMPRYRAFRRDLLMPHDKKMLPQLVGRTLEEKDRRIAPCLLYCASGVPLEQGPQLAGETLEEKDRRVAPYLMYCARDVLLEQGWELDKLSDYAQKMTADDIQKLSQNIRKTTDHWDYPESTHIVNLNELYPGVPDLLLYLVCVYFYDRQMADVGAHLATRMNADVSGIVDALAGFTVVTPHAEAIYNRRVATAAEATAAAVKAAEASWDAHDQWRRRRGEREWPGPQG
jgi:hypothetical protein